MFKVFFLCQCGVDINDRSMAYDRVLLKGVLFHIDVCLLNIAPYVAIKFNSVEANFRQ